MFRGRNYVFFKSDKTHEDSIVVGGRELYFDASYDQHRNARIYGTVVSIPYKLTGIVIGQFPQGKPKYSDGIPEFRYIDEIAQEIELRDRIYFHFNTLAYPDQSRMMFDEAGDPIYAVRYDLIYAAVRHGVIIPIGGNVLIEPMKESIDDILHPTRDLEGNLMDKGKWIQLKSQPGNIYLQGHIRHIGTPLRNDGPQILQPNDKVIFQANRDMIVKIEGTEYYVMKRKFILGKVDEASRATVAA